MWPASASRPSETSAVADAMPTRRGPSVVRGCGRLKRFSRAGLVEPTARGQQAQRAVADRAAHPQPIARARPGTGQAAAARHAAEGGDGDGERSRRDHRVAAAQHDAVAALIRRQAAGEACDPALLPALRKRQRELIGERRRTAGREIGETDAQRLGGHDLGFLVGQEMNTRHDRVGLHHEIIFRIGGEKGVVALEPAGALEAAGERREVAGYELEFADAPAARHRLATARARRTAPGAPHGRARN